MRIASIRKSGTGNFATGKPRSDSTKTTASRREIKVWGRLVRRRYFRSRMANIADYADLLRAGGIVCAALWPLYGFFCKYELGYFEYMGMRWLMAASFLTLWFLAWKRRFGNFARWAWIALSAVGMVWLPWSLYLRTERSNYWQLSIIFFSIALALCVRGIDLPLSIAIGAALLAVQHGADFAKADLPLLPVVGITLLGTYISVQVLRDAKKRIEEQAEEISVQNQKLKQLHRRKDEFTASIAHDLRTPLAVAMSLAEDMSNSDLTSNSRRKLESLAQALRQMKRQSEDLLDLERFHLGVAKIDPVVLDISAWLRRFEEGFSSMARARGLSFQIILAQRQIAARFDPIRLEAALFNLVSNAFKFTPPDGHVEVHLRRHGERGIGIAVLDDGEGIPPEALPKIFERYEQVDRGPGTYTAGVGIGLALVREIAEIHGGRVEVQSTLGLGSLFEIVLEDAVVDETPAPLESVRNVRTGSLLSARPRRAGALILVVEDQQLLRHVLRDILESVARVATACDGAEALRLVHELRPDAVVSDISMPGMDGLQLLASLRADPTTSGIPMVLLSGDVLSVRDRLADEPGIAILSKPFDQEKLVSTVEGMLEREEPTPA